MYTFPIAGSELEDAFGQVCWKLLARQRSSAEVKRLKRVSEVDGSVMENVISSAELFRSRFVTQMPVQLANGAAVNVGGGEAAEVMIPEAELLGNVRCMVESFMAGPFDSRRHVVMLGLSKGFLVQMVLDEKLKVEKEIGAGAELGPAVTVMQDPRIKFLSVENIQELLCALRTLQECVGTGPLLVLLFDLPQLLRHASEPKAAEAGGLRGADGARSYTAAVKEVLGKAQAVSLGCTPVAVTLTEEPVYKVATYTRSAIVQGRPDGESPLNSLQPV
jgi:hypothetical protein